MANFYFDGIYEIAKELESLCTVTDEISLTIVDEAAEIMDKELSNAIRENTKKYGTGTLAKSIHHNKPRINNLGAFTVSTAKGTDNRGKGKIKGKSKRTSKNGKNYEVEVSKNQSDSIRNQDKLWYLENGTSRQNPHPIIGKCIRKAEPAVLEKMQKVFNRETENM